MFTFMEELGPLSSLVYLFEFSCLTNLDLLEERDGKKDAGRTEEVGRIEEGRGRMEEVGEGTKRVGG